MGELLKEMPSAAGQPRKNSSPSVNNTYTLEDLGITRNESSRCQRIRDIPDAVVPGWHGLKTGVPSDADAVRGACAGHP